MPRAVTIGNDVASSIAARGNDWRCGAVIYQVIVDRFAPAADLAAKRRLYAPPKILRDWSHEPRRGKKHDDLGLWSHELEFFGGDLASLATKLDYVHSLGVDVLYLNPIHAAFTNHKYDAQDYAAISPEYGTRHDVRRLAKDCHARGLRLMLDGVFNHMGKTSPKFVDALANAKSRYRDWFHIGAQYKAGYRCWFNVANLPEINLENPAVRRHIYAARDSVVQSMLRDGVDGWRLDVAYDIGPAYLAQLTAAAHAARRGSWVVGEIWNYPEAWRDSVDGVMNFHARQIVLDAVEGKITGRHAATMLDRMIADAGIEFILRSWFQLDNHDTPRLRHIVPDPALRRLAMVLMFTLPGCPVIYYGTELGMDGGPDPANRAAMRWDLARDDNADLAFVRKLLALRRDHPAMRTGDWRVLDAEHLLAFSRQTDRTAEGLTVIANPTSRPVTQILSTRDGRHMSGTRLGDLLDESFSVEVFAGRLEITVPPKTVRVLRPIPSDGTREYDPYKRMK